MEAVRKILTIVLLIAFGSECFAQMGKREQNAFLDDVIQKQLPGDGNAELGVAMLDEAEAIKSVIIRNLKDSIMQIDKDIFNHEVYYDRLNSELDFEKKHYADMIVKAHRLRTLMYEQFDIFSLDNLYTTYRQFLYVKWLNDYRKKKIVRINNLKVQIEQTVLELEKQKSIKIEKAKQRGVEDSLLRQIKIRRSALLKNLTNDNVVNNEIRRNNLDSMKVFDYQESRADSSTLFQLQEGYLMWPVHKAVIISYFGQKPHPVFEGVKIKNDGLDFCVPSSEEVKCVYDGVVSKVTILPHNKYVVIVCHGNYYTVYNGLDHVKVVVGKPVERGGVVGSFDTKELYANFNFQVWKGHECLDPYKWLIKYNKK